MLALTSASDMDYAVSPAASVELFAGHHGCHLSAVCNLLPSPFQAGSTKQQSLSSLKLNVWFAGVPHSYTRAILPHSLLAAL